MKKAVYILSLLLFAVGVSAAQDVKPSEIVRIEANAAKGFSYAYFLYVPPALRDEKVRQQTHSIMVIPNNTGKNDDDLSVHEADAKRRLLVNAAIASRLNIAVLTPGFPRPKTDWKIYTHALDRDSMLTEKTEYKRFDLQLVAMIDDALARFANEGLKFDERVLLTGFSASGMFANRFTFLHPKRVKAAAIGSPGGWAIAPAEKFRERSLRYPIGTRDLKTVSGKKLDLKNLQKVPMFLFLGDKDDNDSLVFDDGYDAEDKDLVFELFGKTPVERWEISKTLYAEAKLNAEFKLYPDVKHTVTKEMFADILAFFGKHK